eukprot:422499_1
MGNSTNKTKKEKHIATEEDLRQQLQQIETDKLPDVHDPPNDRQEYFTLIKGYLFDVSKKHTHIIPDDIIGLIALLYPFAFIVEAKALKMCRTQHLKDGLHYLLNAYDNNVLNINRDYWTKPKYIAKFLYYKHPYLKRKEIGEFLSTLEDRLLNANQHKQLLSEYFIFLNITGLSMCNAFRKVLNSGFGLPAEAQKIDRLLTAFANKYVQTNDNDHQISQDDAIVLTYGMLMLHTELHRYYPIHPNQKMGKQQFRSLVNTAHSTLRTDMVDEIYDDIFKCPLF